MTQPNAPYVTCAHCDKQIFEAVPGLWRDEDGFTVCWHVANRMIRNAVVAGDFTKQGHPIRHEPVVRREAANVV